jgi:hypothetical protein
MKKLYPREDGKKNVPPTPPMGHLDRGLVGQKKIVSYFYLIRVEHEKCSEMCVWIVRFDPKLKKWDFF